MEIKYNVVNELELPVFADLEKNIDALESIFSDWGDIVRKKFILEREDGMLSVYIIYIDGLTDNEMVERTITRPFLYEWKEKKVSHKELIKADEAYFLLLFPHYLLVYNQYEYIYFLIQN